MVRGAIWKYELEYRETELEVPYGAQTLYVGEQHGWLCIWMLVDPEVQGMETKMFRAVHTGERFSMSEVRGRIHTVLMEGGSYVAHVFEVWR